MLFRSIYSENIDHLDLIFYTNEHLTELKRYIPYFKNDIDWILYLRTPYDDTDLELLSEGEDDTDLE